MSEVGLVENQVTKDELAHLGGHTPNGQDVGDDSLDAQFNLLESTLANSNDDLQTFSNSTKEDDPGFTKNNSLLEPLDFLGGNTDIISTMPSTSETEQRPTSSLRCDTHSYSGETPVDSNEIFETQLNDESLIEEKIDSHCEESKLQFCNKSNNFSVSSLDTTESNLNISGSSTLDNNAVQALEIDTTNTLSLIQKSTTGNQEVVTDYNVDNNRTSSESKNLDNHQNNTNQVDESLVSNKKVYCSTPNKNHFLSEEVINDDFGEITPLNKNKLQLDENEINLGRKRKQLECIEEVDENLSDSRIEKKIKCELSEVVNSEELPVKGEVNRSGTLPIIPCYEAPAKSILKKWQSSNLARSASSTFLVLDECGESDVEDANAASSQLSIEGDEIDDFEIACKSLNEELMKCTSNIDNLEKYQSQDMESQMDVEKLDEYLQELGQNFDLGDKTSLTIKTMEESKLFEKNFIDLDKTLVDGNKTLVSEEQVNNILNDIEADEKKIVEQPNSENNQSNPATESHKEIIGGKENYDELNCNEQAIDEEDFLLSEEANEKKKPYVYFEFVSENPKENEDNYNPEWQKFGRLTSDEERYKAVRDRWRSLVPPDPNRNFTVRQWRKKNNLPPLVLLNNNDHYMAYEDGEKTQLCTAVYQRQISKLQQELKEETNKFSHQLNREFDQLGMKQDAQQMALVRYGGNTYDLNLLHRRQIQECHELKLHYEKKHQAFKYKIESKINQLKKASEEVFLFQKYYRGVKATDDSACLYSDVQVQELVETEQVLERYSQFYKG